MNYKYLLPNYFKNFSCIGRDCEETCCKNWRITIDKSTYKRYQKLTSNEFNLFSDDKILLLNNGEDRDQYAYFKLREKDDACPFLDNDLLCSIYKNLGRINLCRTCRIYPREVVWVDGSKELSLTLSCPEAARLILLPEKPIEFKSLNEIKGFIRNDLSIYNRSINVKYETNERKYFWEIRTRAISIFQNRKFDIKQRLMLLGMMYDKIENLVNNQNYDEIPTALDSFANSISFMEEKDLVFNIEKNRNAQSTFFSYLAAILSVSNSKGSVNEELLKIFSEFVNKSNDENELAFQEKRLDDIFSKVDYFLDKHNYMVENYLVNEYFRLLMPFGEFDSIRQSLILLFVNYCLVRLSLYHEYSNGHSLSQDIIVEKIYKISRDFMHKGKYIKNIENLVEKYDINSLAGLYTMIY